MNTHPTPAVEMTSDLIVYLVYLLTCLAGGLRLGWLLVDNQRRR